MIICVLLMVIFFVKVSPQNNQYVKNIVQNLFESSPGKKPIVSRTSGLIEMPDNVLSPEELKQKVAQLYLDSLGRVMKEKKEEIPIGHKLPDSLLTKTGKPHIPVSNIHTPPFQHKWDTTALQKRLIVNIIKGELVTLKKDTMEGQRKWPGKFLAFQQTFNYFKKHPAGILTGVGIGNFSSKLAFRVSALGIAGSYPVKYQYINTSFATNHLALYLYYFTKSDSVHSLTNSPNSVYDQVFSEYGLLGFAGLVIFYIGFFTKEYKKLTYGIPLLIMLLGIFFTEYWFEQLSVIILFELFIFLNLKETA